MSVNKYDPVNFKTKANKISNPNGLKKVANKSNIVDSLVF